MFSYSILAVLDEFEEASRLAGRLTKIDRELIELGGKAYLSGRVGYGSGEWRQHYGDSFELGSGWKDKFDPDRLFRWEGMPFDNGPVASARSGKT